jgi:hypothetical protein
MERSAWFAGIIGDSCSLLFPASRDNTAVQIEGHVVEGKLFREPLLQQRENRIIALPVELMEESVVGAL